MGLIMIVLKYNMDYYLYYLNINDIKNFVKIFVNFKGLVGCGNFFNLKKKSFYFKKQEIIFCVF